MSAPAIKIEGLCKEYVIGGREQGKETFREMLAGAFAAPFRRFRGDVPHDHFWALRDVNVEVQAGEMVGIIGRNGAGKSTLLKILSSITEPTRGRIRIHGRLASLLEVGTGFHPELTGRENVFLNGAILGMRHREIQKRFDQIVEFADVGSFLDTPVKRYSSGMYMRLAFSVAAHLDPDILIVDEVLAVGDFAFQRKCMDLLSNVGRGGKTVLLVSHNLTAIEQLADRAILLEAGSITRDGPAREVIRHYVSSDDISSPRPAQSEGAGLTIHSLDISPQGDSDIPSELVIRLRVSLPVALNSLSIGLAVSNLVGSGVLDTLVRIPHLGVGQHEISIVVMEPRLAPGEYTVKAGIMAEKMALMYFPAFGGFRISASSQTDPYLVEKAGTLGVYARNRYAISHID